MTVWLNIRDCFSKGILLKSNVVSVWVLALVKTMSSHG